MATIKVTDKSFQDDVIGSSQPVLVDFWAEWCGPCKQIGPALEQISDDMGERIKVAKVNIDDDPETPAKFHVRGIPTLMIFKDGQVVATKVGAMTKTKLEEWVSEHA
ncbi:MAG: thioredoxin [Maricaulaceae bacterium]